LEKALVDGQEEEGSPELRDDSPEEDNISHHDSPTPQTGLQSSYIPVPRTPLSNREMRNWSETPGTEDSRGSTDYDDIDNDSDDSSTPTVSTMNTPTPGGTGNLFGKKGGNKSYSNGLGYVEGAMKGNQKWGMFFCYY